MPQLSARGCLVAAVCFVFFIAPHCAALLQKAQSADLFIDSVCVNTHFRFAGTAYTTNQTQLIQLLADAGIHNVRDDSPGVALQLAAKGIKMNYGVFELAWNTDSNINNTRQVVQKIKTAINNGLLVDAIMGINEPDGTWPQKNITYNGKGFPNGTMEYMRDMYTLLRQDSFFKDRWIIGAPLAVWAVLPANCCSQWVDFGDMHPYPFNGNWLTDTFQSYGNITRYFYNSNQPSTNLDQFPTNWNQAKAYYPNRPWFATETGYSTEQGGMGTSIRAQGLYTNRIFTEYFRLGIRRTCVYELVDQHDQPTAHESNFGLLYSNYSAKPSYTALKNMMALLRSSWAPSAGQLRPPTYELGSLDFSLNVSAVGIWDRTDYVHHLLLQKPDGLFLLLLWHEISDEDTKTQPHRQIYPPRMPTVLSLPPDRYTVRVYAPHDGPGLSGAYSVDGRSTFTHESRISLMVPDHVLVLEVEETDTSGGASITSRAWWHSFLPL